MLVPGDGEEDASVFRLGNHEGGGSGQERAVEDDVGALANGKHVLRRGLIEPAHGVGENSGRIEDRPRLHLVVTSGLQVFHPRSADFATFLEQADDLGVIDRSATEIGKGKGQRRGQAGIVELAVGVKNAAL